MDQKKVTIEKIEYMSSDRAGNPRFRVYTDGGVFTTISGGAVALGIQNQEFQGEVILTLEKGEIVGVSSVDGKHFTGRQQ
ncbi:hypothetical protein [Rhodococcus pyridinivorans]|uniref:hypothetical protein n=1 Tax=Rhodococcus pyridinivorans TaxID=103816 RepID=UPI00265A98C1|nr:hypothetical protein [Rhodococcus pyridinivorans]